MLTIENIHKINGYILKVKGKGWYFKGWDNTTSEVTHFSIREVGPSSIQIKHITLHKKGRMVFDDIQKSKGCYVYGVAIDGLLFHYTKERLNTPEKFRNEIEQILNAIAC
jgi:hypothetical protein